MFAKFEKAKQIRQNNEGKISELEDQELFKFSDQLKDLETSLLSSIKEHIEKASEASNYSKMILEKELLDLHRKQQNELNDLKQCEEYYHYYML